MLYANLYILLTGGPGVGKTDALRNVTEFWRSLPELHVAPSSVSRASLTDSLNAASRSILRPLDGAFAKFNSLQVCAEEFGTFLTAYETEFMSTLNHIYDCVRYTEKKRSMKEAIDIPEPHMTLIAATTPAWLSQALPDHAWSEGFASRTLIVYSGDKIKVDPWAELQSDEVLNQKLISDLQDIHSMYGHFRISEEFQAVYAEWYAKDCPPIPDHPKLEHYLPRRHIHLLKLCMVMSAARASDYILRIEDFQAAMNLLIETESFIPDVFKSMSFTTDTNVYDETFNFVWTNYVKEDKAIAEHRIVQFIARRAPSHSVLRILEVMVSSQMLIIDSVTGPGGRPTYRPTPRATHNS